MSDTLTKQNESTAKQDGIGALPILDASILKGSTFTQRVQEICHGGFEIAPLANLKYRRILAPGMLGGEILFATQGFALAAMQMRGAEVTCLLCDQTLPACTARKAEHVESACTRWCHKNAGPFARATGLPHRWYGQFITEQEKQACDEIAQQVAPDVIPDFSWKGIHLGTHIVRSLESYFKVGRVDFADAATVTQARQFVRSALYLIKIGRRVLDELAIDKVVMVDGAKIDWGVMREVARQKGIPVDVLRDAPRGHATLVESDRPGTPTARMASWDRWRSEKLTDAQDRQLDAYFDRRSVKPYVDKTLCAATQTSASAEVRQAIGLSKRSADRTPGASKIFGLFPNVGFDAGITKGNAAYETATDWIMDTVSWFAAQDDHHLVVKVHPGERYNHVIETTVDLLATRFPSLPDHIHVVGPDTKLTAHDVIRELDVALVYTSTVAIEAAYLNTPVVLAGGGWHANRGITIDARTPAHHREILADICSGRMPAPPPGDLGRRYAYALFFRASIPIEHYEALDQNVTRINLSSLADLRPGMNASIDLICRGVLLDEPFERDCS